MNSTRVGRWELADASTCAVFLVGKDARKRKECTMKSEDSVRTGFPLHDDLPPPSFSARALAGANSDELGKLRADNVRLQLLVAELLVENQQLRQRYNSRRRDAEHSGSSTAHPSDLRDPRDH